MERSEPLTLAAPQRQSQVHVKERLHGIKTSKVTRKWSQTETISLYRKRTAGPVVLILLRMRALTEILKWFRLHQFTCLAGHYIIWKKGHVDCTGSLSICEVCHELSRISWSRNFTKKNEYVPSKYEIVLSSTPSTQDRLTGQAWLERSGSEARLARKKLVPFYFSFLFYCSAIVLDKKKKVIGAPG